MKLKSIFSDKKKQHSILLLSVVIIFMITVIAAFFGIYYNNAINNYSLTVKSNIKTQINEDNAFNNTLKNFAISFTSNDAVTKILSTPEGYADPLVQFEVSTLLMQYKTTIDEIQNIYLYNHAYNILYNCGELHTLLPEFMPAELYNELQKKPSEKTKLVAVKSNNYTLLYQIFSSANTNINNSIIVELTPSALKKNYDLQNYPDSKLIITNIRGDIVYSNSEEYLFGSNISEYITLNSKSLYSSVDFEIIDTGKKEVLSSYISDSSEKNYYVITPYLSVIFNNSSALVSVIFLCITAIMLITIIYFILKTSKKGDIKNIYFPFPPQPSGKNAVYNIPGSNHSQDTEILPKQNLSPLSNYVLIHIIPEDFETIAAQSTPRDIDLYLYGLNNIFSELITNCGYKPINLQISSDKMIYVIEGMESDSYINKLQNIAHEFTSTCHSYINVNPSVYVSSVFQGNKLIYAQKQLDELINYRFFYKNNVILFRDKDIHPKNAIITDNFIFKSKHLTSSIYNNSCSKEEILDIINDCFDTLKKMEYTEAKEKLLSLFFEFYYNLKIMIFKNLYQIYMVNIAEYVNHLNSADNIYEAKDIFENIVSNLYENISNMNSSKERNYLQNCTDIIEKKFSDPMLTPEYIAAEIGLSSSYLSKKLREYSSVSLSNMIKERRLTEAAKLLTDSSDSIGKIVSKCGFIDKSYFTVVFKKSFNCTPTEYRKNYSLNKLSQSDTNE